MYATVKIVWATLFLWPVALVYMHQMHKEVGFLLYFEQTFVTGHQPPSHTQGRLLGLKSTSATSRIFDNIFLGITISIHC